MAVDYGGGIFNEGTVRLVDSRVQNNIAVRDGKDMSFGGGGIENRGNLYLTRTIVKSNTSQGTQSLDEEIDNGGGGINNNVNGMLIMRDSVIFGNTAFNAGGIRSIQGTMEIRRSTIKSNTCTGLVGGGIVVVNSVATIRNSMILKNTTLGPFGNSGGISSEASISTLVGVTIRDNAATLYGGGITVATLRVGGDSRVNATRCTFADNSARFGGGTAVIDASELSTNFCTYRRNSAQDGGAI